MTMREEIIKLARRMGFFPSVVRNLETCSENDLIYWGLKQRILDQKARPQHRPYRMRRGGKPS
jgi:hypothetical protein